MKGNGVYGMNWETRHQKGGENTWPAKVYEMGKREGMDSGNIKMGYELNIQTRMMSESYRLVLLGYWKHFMRRGTK